jgi:PqqD family protein of HPr-rel-A system
MDSEVLWRVVPAFELHWRCWDDEYIVFNSGSGDTHLFDKDSAEVLQLLEQSPFTEQQLINKIFSSPPGESDEEELQYLKQLLINLHQLGLIEIYHSESF